MLNPYLKDDSEYKFAVIDIETDCNGNPILSGYYDGNNYQEFDSITQLIECIEDSDRDVIYAHSGIRFDYSLLLRAFVKSGSLTVSYSGSQGISMSFLSRRYKGKRITLLDSYRLLPASLKSLSLKFCPEKSKIELDCMPWDLPRNLLSEYLQRDCESLYLVIERFWSIIEDKFGKLRANTLSALSLKIFRKCYQKESFMGANGKLYQYELDSYFGGVCYCNPGHYNVNVYDVNSMYPFVMKKYEYPTSYVGRWTRNYKSNMGLYRCKFSYSGLPFVYDYETRTLVNEGKAILDNETVDYLKNKGICDVIEGYEYLRYGNIFEDFVTDIYAMRINYGEPLKFVFKILLNSLYGKFGQKRIRRSVSTIQPKGRFKVYDINLNITGKGLPQYAELFDYEERAIVQHSIPVIASMVTLHSRRYLHQLAGSNCVYADTDSIHLINNDIRETSNELGGLKLEYSGKAAYIQKKIYQFENGVTKCKGIPSKIMQNVNLFNMVSPRTFEFDNYPSILSQVKTDKEFQKVTVTRTINI